MPAFVQSYSQSQARLMFVTALPEMGNFDCTKMNAHFEKFTACLREGFIHEWKQVLLAPPLPLMSLNNSLLCFTHSHHSALGCQTVHCSTNDKLRILFKAQPSTRSIWPRSPTRLGIRYGRETWADIMHYSQLLTLQHSSNSFFCFVCFCF